MDVVALAASDPAVLSLCDTEVSGLADAREAVRRLELSQCVLSMFALCILRTVNIGSLVVALAYLDAVVSGAPSLKMNVAPSGAVLETMTGSPVSSVKWTWGAVMPSSTLAP